MDTNYVEVAWKNGKVRLEGLTDDQLDDVLNFVKSKYIRVDNTINVGGSESSNGDKLPDNEPGKL